MVGGWLMDGAARVPAVAMSPLPRWGAGVQDRGFNPILPSRSEESSHYPYPCDRLRDQGTTAPG